MRGYVALEPARRGKPFPAGLTHVAATAFGGWRLPKIVVEDVVAEQARFAVVVRC